MPKLMENLKEKKYREAETAEKVNESKDNELFKLLKENEIENNIFVELKVLEDKDDKEGLLGQEGQYIAKAVVSARIGDYIRNTEALTVEVFNNKEDLKLRVAYLQAQNDYLDGVYNDKYGYLPQILDLPSKRAFFAKGNALLIMDSSISDDEKLNFCSLFYDSVKKIDYKEKYVLDKDKIKTVKGENNKRLTNWKNKYPKDELLSTLETLQEQMNKRVEIAYALSNKDLITNILDELKFYDVARFKDQYSLWTEKLTKAKQSLDNGNILPEALEKQNHYKQTVYTDGRYVIGEDILPGEYVVVKNEGFQNAEVSVNYYNAKVFGNTIIDVSVDGLGKINDRTIKLEGATMYHIDNSSWLGLRTPGTFKVGKHIEAGEYEISSSSHSGFYLIDKSIDGVIDEIELKDAYRSIDSGIKTIAVRDGQYLILEESAIQIKKK